MNKYYTLLLLVVATGFVSCVDEFSTQQIEVTYDTVSFDRIHLETSSSVRIIQSSAFKVTVNGEERDVHDTDVHVSNNQLVIEEHGHIANDQVIKIYVPEISQLESEGSSLIYGESEFTQNRSMDLVLNGSGEINMYVDVDNLDVEQTGSGYVYLEGYADHVDAEITGSGWMRAFGLDAKTMDLRVEGSGSSEVKVADDLDVKITGSGNVFYKGHPSLHTEITGSGQVIDSN